jgi:hypothetical protein
MTHNPSDSSSGTEPGAPSATAVGLDLHDGVGLHRTIDTAHIELALDAWEPPGTYVELANGEPVLSNNVAARRTPRWWPACAGTTGG